MLEQQRRIDALYVAKFGGVGFVEVSEVQQRAFFWIGSRRRVARGQARQRSPCIELKPVLPVRDLLRVLSVNHPAEFSERLRLSLRKE